MQILTCRPPLSSLIGQNISGTCPASEQFQFKSISLIPIEYLKCAMLIIICWWQFFFVDHHQNSVFELRTNIIYRKSIDGQREKSFYLFYSIGSWKLAVAYTSNVMILDLSHPNFHKLVPLKCNCSITQLRHANSLI